MNYKNCNIFGYLLSTAIALVLAFIGCVKDESFSYQQQDRQILMLDSIRRDTSMSITIAALEKANLSAVLGVYGPVTFFAPDNNAFRKYFANQGKSGLEDFTKEEIELIMNYHILPTRLKSFEFIQGPQLMATGKGDKITLDISQGYKFNTVANGKAKLYATDIEFSNGYMHKMDGVLDPPVLTIGEFLTQNQDQYSIFYKGLEKAGLLDTLTRLTNSSNERIRLTLFAETNSVLTAAGITSYEAMPADELRKLMRNHIVRGDNSSSNYTKLVPAFQPYKLIERWDSAMVTLDGQDWMYFNLAANNLINNSIDFAASDVLMRNGLVHNVNKPLRFDVDPPRTQISHIFWQETNYCYGIPGIAAGQVPVNATSGNWRYYWEGSTIAQNFLFMGADGINDSLVTVVRGIRRGKYSIAINYKNSNRGDYQLYCGADSIGPRYNYNTAPQFRQNYVLGTYEFKRSGDTRLNFVCKRAGGLNVESMILTPVD